MREFPHLRRVHEQYRDRGFEILGVAFVEGGESGKKWLTDYLERKGATWPQAVSGSADWYGPPFEAYDVRYLPLQLLLDANGRIVAANPSGPRLEEAIEQALGTD